MKSRASFCIVGIALLLSSLQAARPPQRKTLSFADRVAYQYAIEEIYWRHRIWPKENPDPKPSLDQVISRTQIEKKVEDYVLDSQLLADELRPITPDHLQAEMDRMASHTKRPDVLRELFAALNNDPFVIAECLARPILVDRLVSVRNDVEAFAAANTWGLSTGAPISQYKLPEMAPLDCADDSWTPTSLTNAPTGRDLHTAVWTGSEMIVWGGELENTGAKYDPTTDSWTATSTVNAPSARFGHTAVWTGIEMIVWGGGDGINYSNIGGRYNPSTDSWTATSTVNAPSGRAGHTAVWTGSEMIVWGGSDFFGGRYNPATNSWTPTSLTNVPTARQRHTAVWTGSEMIVWGGDDFGGHYLNTGGRYDPSTNSWTATDTANAPAARLFHTAVWTGGEMIVWGGYIGGSINVNTGGRYNPSTNSWTATNTTNAPERRVSPTAVWTGGEMIVWGGEDTSALNTGGKYNPGTNSWTATNTVNAPSARYGHTAVWTGSEMIVWGGYNNGTYLNTGGRYCAHSQTPVVTSSFSQKIHGSAGTFNVDLPRSGGAGIECRAGGATSNYTIVVTFGGNVTVTGNPQAEVTLGTGCVGSGGACSGNVSVSGNTVTIPLTNIANAQTINVRLNGVNNAAGDAPATDFTIPMSILIGDSNADATVNATDVAQTKSRLGQTVDATNFRSDVNANGTISATDVSILKSHLGTGLP